MASGSGRLATGVHTIWEDNSPDSLVDLSARCVLANPGLLFNVKPQAAGRGGGRRTATGRRLKAASFGDEDEELEEDFDDDDEDADRELEDERNFVDFDAIHEGIVLPAEICERLVETMISEGLDIDDRVAKAFSDTTVTRLRRCCLRGSTISPPGFERLAKHKPREILIHNCDRLNSSDVLESLNGNMDNTVELTITGMLHGSRDGILPCAVTSIDTLYDDLSEDSMDEDDKEAGKFESRGYILKGPNLQRLSIHDLEIRQGVKYFELLLRPLNKLTHLDLSGARHREGFGDFEWLLPTNNTLVSLVLHNVPELDQTALNTISKLTKLRHLDISQNSQKQGEGTYDYPNIVLRRLVESLSNLRSLDISGTNLAGNGSFDIEQNASPTINSEEKHKVDPPAEEKPDARPEGFTAKCDIPGLSSRVDRPLDFLGLYRTHHGASCRVHIPAKEISGDLNEAHILTAGKRYLDRPFVLENVLNDLFGIFRYENCSNLKEALDIILLAMERHPDEKVIQISGSASLYYAVKSEIRGAINVKVKRKILSTLLNGMFAHRHDTVMMRNGCLTLCQFQIPQDVKFDYERLVKILLYVVSKHTTVENNETNFVQRAGICLLNSLACQVDGQQKLLVGSLGAMEKMLELIRDRVQSGTCDDVMETAWSTMWNVTDETPVNCKRFLDGGGMQLFLKCKEKFHNSQDLLRNMMGLLGNVAEVPSLRPQLMTSAFVSEFSMLLDSTSDGIEVSYNAAGVLAHMASDGAEAWTIDDPPREEVLGRMVSAIERWDINTKRNINYRSFEPILRLVRIAHTPECQHWAVWALANLTRTDKKYCSLIEEEGGLSLLENLINRNSQPFSNFRVMELASIVRDNVSNWKERQYQVVAIDESLVLDG